MKRMNRTAFAMAALALGLAMGCDDSDDDDDDCPDENPECNYAIPEDDAVEKAAARHHEHAERAFPGRTGEQVTGLVDIDGEAVELTWEVIDGLAIIEGDIVLGTAEDVARRSEELASGVAPRSAVRTASGARWLSHIVPYEISSALPSGRRDEIRQAINHWNANTVIRLVQRTTEPDFVRFVDGAGCSSFVGRVGNGVQNITMGPGCGRGQAIHEIGHAVGLWHEHTRTDRNTFVTINAQNIQQGMAFNFTRYIDAGSDGQDVRNYDFGSIMHYSSDAFSNGNGPTIVRASDGSTFTAQRNALSASDIAGVARYYIFDDGDTHSLRNQNSQKCLDIPSSSIAPIDRLQQFTCHGGDNQLLYMYEWPLTDDVLLVMDHSTMCLTATWDFVTGEGYIQQRNCNGSAWQRWETYWENGGFRFRNLGTGRCMDVANASLADQAKVNHFPCHGGANQGWWLFFP